MMRRHTQLARPRRTHAPQCLTDTQEDACKQTVLDTRVSARKRSTWRGCRRTASWGRRSCRTCTCAEAAWCVSAARLSRHGAASAYSLAWLPARAETRVERQHASTRERFTALHCAAHHRRSPSATRWLRGVRAAELSRTDEARAAVLPAMRTHHRSRTSSWRASLRVRTRESEVRMSGGGRRRQRRAARSAWPSDAKRSRTVAVAVLVAGLAAGALAGAHDNGGAPWSVMRQRGPSHSPLQSAAGLVLRPAARLPGPARRRRRSPARRLAVGARLRNAALEPAWGGGKGATARTGGARGHGAARRHGGDGEEAGEGRHAARVARSGCRARQKHKKRGARVASR